MGLSLKYLSRNIVLLNFSFMLIVFVSFAYAEDSLHSDIQTFVNTDKDVVSYEDKEFDVTVKDVNVLISNNLQILLWGVEKVSPNKTIFNLKARNKLEKVIGEALVSCTIKSKEEGKSLIKAQCVNSQKDDLSLFLLQNGFVSADRAEIQGTIFEEPYLEAERKAQENNMGIWALGDDPNSSADRQGKNFMIGAIFLMLVFVFALGVLGFFLARGFKRVVDVQNHSLDLAMKERDLKDKEKLIIASMIKSEIIENKAKIEAYLVIYEEMLKDFSSEEGALILQKTGEIIQKQPALSRSVFDGNTNKLDLFGTIISSHVIHYYARIKTSPDYVEVGPDTPVSEVKEIIENAVSNAKKLYDISDKLLQSFIDNALIKEIS